jgi:SAM-dependent methyltransferase
MEMYPSPTAGWSDEEQVSWYLDRLETLQPRLAGEAVLRELLPAQPRSLLDLGCGDGRLMSLVLEDRPSLQRACGVDVSPPMLERARQRFAGQERVEVREWDLDTDVRSLGVFDVVVSGFAIHHLADERKQALYAEVASQLTPDGLFANLEIVASATPLLHAEFLHAIGRNADDPEDRLVDVETQLGWMRAAGLDHVECMWRWRGMALLTGRAAPCAAPRPSVPVGSGPVAATPAGAALRW